VKYSNVKNIHESLTTVIRAQNDTSKTQISTDTIFNNKKVTIVSSKLRKCQLLQLYNHLFYWKLYQLIFAVLEVSFWVLTTVAKRPWKFLTLFFAVLLPFLSKLTTCSCHLRHCYIISNSLSWGGRSLLP